MGRSGRSMGGGHWKVGACFSHLLAVFPCAASLAVSQGGAAVFSFVAHSLQRQQLFFKNTAPVPLASLDAPIHMWPGELLSITVNYCHLLSLTVNYCRGAYS